jgi:hypothetical protein
MSWELRLEQLAFDTEVSDMLIEGQDCLVMAAHPRMLAIRHFDPELDLEGTAFHRAVNALRSVRQQDFEQSIRRLGSKVNRVAYFQRPTKGDIQQDENELDDDIENGWTFCHYWKYQLNNPRTEY